MYSKIRNFFIGNPNNDDYLFVLATGIALKNVNQAIGVLFSLHKKCVYF